MLTGLSVRSLGRSHHDRVAAALAADPIAGCLIAERFEVAGMDPGQLGGTFWGVGGGRDAIAFVGGNLVPLSGDPAALRQLAVALGRRRRSVASLVGSAGLVLPLWQCLEPKWGPAREVRPDQPVMTCRLPPAVAPDPEVRQVDQRLLDAYYPAAVRMFTEEVGVDPRGADSADRAYRNRVRDLMQRGHAFALFVDGQVAFKAEIGAVSSTVAMIQGVWVDPRFRGQGLAGPGVAALVRHVQGRGLLPALYVNHHNTVARRAYTRVGFEQVGTFASVLF